MAACATGNGPHGTLVLATEEGQVRRYDAQARQWRPMSRLFPFALGGAALDLSIDGGSRFVAVLSTRRSAACRNGADGHLLRIWNLQLKQPGYPVASACIARPLRAIGPLEKTTGGAWVLPLYQAPAGGLSGSTLLRHDFACLACADSSAERALDSKLKAQAEALGARKVDTGALQQDYGIAL